MRFLERIGSWLRAPVRVDDARPQQHLDRGVDPSLLTRMPRASSDAFRGLLLDGVRRAHDEGRVLMADLDPSVRVLILPTRESMRGGATLSAQIDAALRDLEGTERSWSSITWSALRDARPPFSPTSSEWAGELAHRFEGDAGLIFFVDVESVALSMSHAAEAAGLKARIDDDAMLVRVTDGRFEAHVGTSALLAEALWTARGPWAVVARRANALPNELRSFQQTLKGLERRFPAVRFDVRPEGIVARAPDGSTKVDYRRTSVAMRSAGLSADAWLGRIQLEDLSEDGADPLVLVRSPAYLKAYPNALSAPASKYALVAVREKDGRTTPVVRMPGDHEGRFAHYQDEASRQLPFFSFTGYAFVVEQAQKGGAARAACIVGDKAATVAIHDPLVRGALEQLLPLEGRLRVYAATENTAWFVSDRATDALLTEVQRRARELELDLFGDSSDALTIERTMDMPAVGFGHFDLTAVPEAFFSLRDQATSRSDIGRGHSDYLRGMSYELLGKDDAALPCFERAVRQSSGDGEMNLALGRVLTRLNEPGRAVVFLERAVAALDDHAEAHHALGGTLYKVGRAADAREAFRRAIALAPDEAPYLVGLGRACADDELYTEARTSLEKALRLDPSHAEAHAILAVVCHKTGHRDAAMHHAREALSEQPDDETVRELLKLLEEDGSKTAG